MSLSDKSLIELEKAIEDTVADVETGEVINLKGYELDNGIATKGVRRFLERWRKKYGKSVKHWLITELGQKKTERLHLHGILWTQESKETIEEIWKYGNVWIGEYVNERTINYIVKYVSKTDIKHKEYKPKILTSAGIGKGYMNREDAKDNKYKKGKTREIYRTRQGVKLGLPIYYRNHIYSEEEREKLWIEKLDEEVRWVDGMKIDISKGEEIYYNRLETIRRRNEEFKYGNDKINWERRKYENQRRNMKKIERTQKEHAKSLRRTQGQKED